jgi:tRNA-dihydrouridine synthase B
LTNAAGAGESGAEPLRIGDVVVDPPLVLGPMAGTTNRVYRLLCRRGGAGLVCSEMVSINAIAQGSSRTFRMMRTFEGEHPVSIQLFGSEPEIMRDTAPASVECGADVVDINMGCSVPKIRRNNAGVALMGDPKRAAALTAAAVEASEVPVTVKIRAGLTEDDDSWVETARRLQDAGAAAIALHARTAAQSFRGEADWRQIARLVEALDVPVIGNGDVTEPEDAARMQRETGCAAVMVARGAWGRPWVFASMAAAMRGESISPEPDPAGRLGVALLHAQLLAEEMNESLALHQMRTQMHHYVHGLPQARRFRAGATRISSLDELRRLVQDYAALMHAEAQSSPAGPPR